MKDSVRSSILTDTRKSLYLINMGLDITISRNRGNKEIAYFRKVNFLVKFMEDYYDHIIENCEPIQIDEDCILELKWRCESVLKNRKLADSLLPTVSGFFLR